MKHYHAALLIAAALFYSLIIQAPPSVYPGDSPEVAAAAYSLGVMHPPGYPLYAVAGKIIISVLPGDEAFRLNVFSAFLAALLFLTLYFLSRESLAGRIKGTALFAASAAGALLFCSTHLFRINAMTAKGGIYISALLGIAAASYCALKAYGREGAKFCYLAIFISGFLPALHHAAVLPSFFVIFICLTAGRKDINKPFAFFLYLTALITPWLYLFIRANGGAAFSWGGISSVSEVIDHIMRKTYSDPSAVPLSLFAAAHKVSVNAVSFLTAYGPAVLLIIFGAFQMKRESPGLFKTLLIYAAANGVLIIAVTSNNTAPLFDYVNSNFYLIPSLVLPLFFAYGIAAVQVAEKKGKLQTAVIAFTAVCAAYPAVAGVRASCNSGAFDSYDFGHSILSQPQKGGVVFGKTDITIYPVFYLKHVKNKFQEIKAYDSNANVLDMSVFSEARKGVFTRQKELETELEIIRLNPEKVHYIDHTEFPKQGLRTVPYGIIYRIRGVTAPPIEMQDSLVRLVSFRNITDRRIKNDYFRRETAGLLLARAAESSAYEGRRERFETYRMLAEDKGRGIASVSKAIAAVYFHYFNDTYKALLYLERAAKEAPYDFAVVELLINIYSASGVKEKALQWMKHYEKREWRKERLSVIRQEIGKIEIK